MLLLIEGANIPPNSEVVRIAGGKAECALGVLCLCCCFSKALTFRQTDHCSLNQPFIPRPLRGRNSKRDNLYKDTAAPTGRGVD